jgi:hypothetical protein
MTVFDLATRMRFAATTLEDVSLMLAEHEDIFAGCSCPGSDPRAYGPDEIGWTAITLRSKAEQLESNKAASRRELLAPQLEGLGSRTR